MIVFFYTLIGLVIQPSGQNPPPPRPPYTPMSQLPIDENMWLWISIAVVVGVYIIVRRNRSRDKDS